jgi:hypothetical protein
MAAEAVDGSTASLPQAWLRALITSHLDSASRVALLQTSRMLCQLVLSTAPTAKLTVDVSCLGAPGSCAQRFA